MNIARPFIRRPIGSALMALALVLVGLTAWRLLPVSPLPQVDFPTIVVSASLPGSSPESMAATVSTPLERALGSIAGISALTSSSAQGTASVILQFELGRDINDAARDVQAAINAVRNQLPSGMPSLPTYRKINPSQAPIMALAISSPNLSPGQIYDLASTVVAQKIAQITGVGEVSLGGASLPAVRVQLNPGMLAHHGIALDEVRTAIAQSNPVRPLGQIEGGERRWQVNTSDSLRKASEYAPLVIRWQDGAAVRLGDVATVTDSVENRYRSGFHNDKPAVVLMISRQTGANIVETIDAIDAQLPALRALLPADATLSVVMDRSPGIRATLKEAQITLLISTVLVVLVVWMFLGSLRTALIPTLAIPVSLIGTYAVMYLYGFSLNNLSLMALIVAAGLVVDDAIVVLENVQRHIERGMAPYRAALRGSAEVNFTLLAMNVSLVAVFLSILFMGGLIERLFREFSITLTAAILISLVLSLTLTPSLCAHLLPPRTERPAGRLARGAGAVFGELKGMYANSLSWSLRHGPVILLLLGAVIGLNAYLYISAPKGLLPQQDTGQIRGFVRGDDGFSFQVMQPKIEAYRRLLLADPAVQDVVGTSGDGGGVSNARLTVRLKPLAERGISAQQVIDRIRAKVPPVPGGILILNVDQDIQFGLSFNQSQSELVLMADDLALLQRWSRVVSEAMQNMPQLVDVDSVGDEGTQQVMLEIDRDAARRLGVDTQTIASILGNSFSQRQVATLYDNQNQYRVVMELAPGYTAQPAVLEHLQAITADGARVPLSAFTRYSYGLGDDRIYHDSQFAATGIGYSLAPGVETQQASEAISRMLAEVMLPTEVQARMGGTARGLQQSMDAQPWLIVGVLLAVYLLLGVLYESTLHPLTILSTLPSAGVGALLALRAGGIEFSLIALLGLFLLIGIVMKNAILMVDFALEAERRDGLSPRDAIHRAALLRLRPILMTNIAGLLGAVPLAIGIGEGSEMRQPLGIAIIGGLAVSQLLTLYTTPVVYLYFERLRLWSLRRTARSGYVS
ncbi:MAG: efflux RND transporter permease subunit [Alphaproteobacteria bacterium]|nr:efflux RND transporter permease subunit [Alphaproteobacteria bacterium]MBU1812125.1 efflux RND transporter permease subunit [Alphaproteobacteria bacterium]